MTITFFNSILYYSILLFSIALLCIVFIKGGATLQLSWTTRAPERWERWECVPSQFEILAATFGQPAAIASEISVHQPKWATGNGGCGANYSKSPKKMREKSTVIWIFSLKTTNVCFLKILETAHSSHYWSVPSQF